MPVPTSDLTNIHLDAPTDDPSQARAEINATTLKVNAIIDAITPNGANDACKLDANGQVTADSIFPVSVSYNLISALTADVKQALLDLDSFAADKRGVTFTGNVNIIATNARLILQMGAATQSSVLEMRDNLGRQRSRLLFIEGTGSVELERRDSSQTIETVLTLSNDGNVSVNGAAPTTINHLTRKDYVDGLVPVVAVTDFVPTTVTYKATTTIGGLADGRALATSGTTVYEVGPTGSGAATIWSELDAIPLNATWIEFRIKLRSAGSNTLLHLINLNGRADGSLDSLTTLTTLMANLLYDSTTDIASHAIIVDNVFTARIPLSSANIMDLRLEYFSTTTGTCNILVTGFGV